MRALGIGTDSSSSGLPNVGCNISRRRARCTGSRLLSLGLASLLATLPLACGDGGPTESATPVATSATITPSAVTLAALGETVQLTASVLDQGGQPMPGTTLIWASSDGSVAPVDAGGVVTAVWNGSTTINVTSGDAATNAVVVVEQQAREIRVSPATDTLRWLGDTLRLSAEALDANEYVVEGAEFSWSSSDESVATVDASGLVTAEGVGWVEITAGTTLSDVTRTITLLVEVLPARDALVALYNATDGPNWTNNENWLTDAPLHDWYGVGTNFGDLAVVRLAENGLSGPIPPELANLVDLWYLDLSANALTGQIPPDLGSLGALQLLILSRNNLTDSIPSELGNLVNLRELRLDNNSLTGSIPRHLGELPNLELLWLDANDLTGPIPPELGSLEKLTNLNLGENALTGSIPPELGSLEKLTNLHLRENALTGPIPPQFGNLTDLMVLGLSDNDLTGSIPPELGNLSNLIAIYSRNNNLTGSIPPELGNLTALAQLWLNNNSLTGSIPPELGELANLDHMKLQGNDLEGPIPAELGKLAKLKTLELSENDLVGALPAEFGNLESLWLLKINLNDELTGPIPLEFTNLSLSIFRWADTKLCAPGDPAFQTWLQSIGTRDMGTVCAP